MKLETLQASLPFTQFVNQKEVNSFKVARITSQNKSVDLFCFPGFSHHQLDDTVQEAIKAIKEIEYSGLIQEPLEVQHPNPHVEHALYQYFLNTNELKTRNEPKLSTLLKSVHDLDGHENFKLKIDDDINKFVNLALTLKEYLKQRPLFRFRLDANQRLSLASLEDFYAILVKHGLNENLEYFEEPIKSFELYKNLSQEIPVAIEENLSELLKNKDNFKPAAIVYKPSQQGISLLKKLSEYSVVISSCFDPDHSFRATKALALKYPMNTHGLAARTRNSELKLLEEKRV